MLLAEVDWPVLLTSGATAVAVVGAAFGGGVVWLFNWANSRRKDMLAEWQEYSAKLLERVEASEEQIAKQQLAIDTLWTMFGDRVVREERLYGFAERLQECCATLLLRLRKHEPVDDVRVPDMPERGPTLADLQAEFIVRTTQHGTQSLHDTARPNPPK